MLTDQNKAVVLRFYAAFEANDQTALKDLLAADLVAYTVGALGPQNRDLHLQIISGWNATFSDTQFIVKEQIAEGDTVATCVTFRAVHSRSEFQGIAPTGKQIEVGGVTIERIKDGKIVERRVHLDWLWIMQQLGLVPLPLLASRKDS